MAQVRDVETGYVRQNSRSEELRREFSSHHNVPAHLRIDNAEIEASIRLGFIRKVYGILAAQMLLTVLVSGYCMSTETIRLAVINIMGSTVMRILFFVPTLAVLCCISAAKNQYPMNFILLFVFTFFMSLDIGFVCAAYTEAGMGMLILEAAFLTTVIFFSLTAYTCVSKKDFSWMGSYLFAALVTMVICGFIGFFVPALVSNLIFACCGALLFSAYIVYDTYRITNVFGYDDYIIAAIELYLDIINLFLYILQILGGNKDN